MSALQLWKNIQQTQAISSLNIDVYRVVESQRRVATMHLVDTLDEQLLLEELIDAAKPDYSLLLSSKKNYHYLIRTPFRYPPLNHGSRFGHRFDPSLFYGSLAIETALAECAYYRFLFFDGMVQSMDGRVENGYSSLKVNASIPCSLIKVPICCVN